jgi:hypothetical protein
MGVLSIFLGLCALAIFWIPILGQLVAGTGVTLACIDWYRARQAAKAGRPRTAILAGVGLGLGLVALAMGSLVLLMLLAVIDAAGGGAPGLLISDDITRF